MEGKLVTIQKHNNLNEVIPLGNKGPGEAYHMYVVIRADELPGVVKEPLATIKFQKGPRQYPDSIHGILDTDLLEIVRHRLQCFQQSEFATRENAIALTHIEEALLWMNKRVEDRAERGVLGTTNK